MKKILIQNDSKNLDEFGITVEQIVKDSKWWQLTSQGIFWYFLRHFIFGQIQHVTIICRSGRFQHERPATRPPVTAHILPGFSVQITHTRRLRIPQCSLGSRCWKKMAILPTTRDRWNKRSHKMLRPHMFLDFGVIEETISPLAPTHSSSKPQLYLHSIWSITWM